MAIVDAAGSTMLASDLVWAMLEAEKQADWRAWAELVSADVIMDHATAGITVGIAESVDFIRGFREAVDDYQRDVFDLVCDGPCAAFRFAITGVLARDVRDLRATGKPFEIAGAAFVTMWGGRVVRVVEILTANTLRG